MRFGKNRLILAKLVSSFLYTSVVYWGITLLYSAVYLMLLGTRGWDLPIQINYPSVSVSYDLNMMQACGLLLLLGSLLKMCIRDRSNPMQHPRSLHKPGDESLLFDKGDIVDFADSFLPQLFDEFRCV